MPAAQPVIVVDAPNCTATVVDSGDMNNTLVTTGLVPLTVGSVLTFRLQAWRDGLPWDITGGTATLLMTDPVGGSHSYPATISGGGASVGWTAALPVGNWTRAWDARDAAGVRQVSRPTVFAVTVSP